VPLWQVQDDEMSVSRVCKGRGGYQDVVRGEAPVQQATSVHMSQGLQDGLCMCDQTIQAGPLVGGGQAAALPPCLLPVTMSAISTHIAE